MKARPLCPAKTISRGSSPTSKVRTTWGVPTSETMLMLSDMWLTTQTSVLLRAATATGSRPTGTWAVCVSEPTPIWYASSVPFGVLTANSVLPSGDLANGRTCPLSNVMKFGGDAAPAELTNNGAPSSALDVAIASARARRVAPISGRKSCVMTLTSLTQFMVMGQDPGLDSVEASFRPATDIAGGS